MFFYILIFLSLLLAGWHFIPQQGNKVAGVYSQPNKYFFIKYFAFLALFKLRKQRQAPKRGSVEEDVGLGKMSRSSIDEMEKPQDLPKEYSKAVDAVYFNGGDAAGCFLVAATARRQDKLTQTLCYLRLPGVGLLSLSNLPDTSLYREQELEYAAGGLRLTPVEAMRKWRLQFSGKMRLEKDGHSSEEVDVEFVLGWEAVTRHFDFDTDLNAHALSTSMATEQWSRQFFDTLKEAHQTHYEQFGEISGAVEVSGHGRLELRLQGVRDHSYGNIRDWKYFHRYAIQYIYLDDKTAICIGNICMPITTSRLIIGYVFSGCDGQMSSVSSTDLQLHKFGEDDPTDFTINFTAGGKNYHVEGRVLERPVFYMGLDWDARIVERMCLYRVNGVQGWGISELAYRHTEGKKA